MPRTHKHDEPENHPLPPSGPYEDPPCGDLGLRREEEVTTTPKPQIPPDTGDE